MIFTNSQWKSDL